MLMGGKRSWPLWGIDKQHFLNRHGTLKWTLACFLGLFLAEEGGDLLETGCSETGLGLWFEPQFAKHDFAEVD